MADMTKLRPFQRRFLRAALRADVDTAAPSGPLRGGTRAWRELRRRCFDRDGWRCRECGGATALEAHHVRPVVEGGADVLGNLRTVCRACHLDVHRRPEDLEREELRRLAFGRQ